MAIDWCQTLECLQKRTFYDPHFSVSFTNSGREKCQFSSASFNGRVFREEIYFEGEWQSEKSRHVIANRELLMPYIRLGLKRRALVHCEEAQGFTCLIVLLHRFRIKTGRQWRRHTQICKRACPMTGREVGFSPFRSDVTLLMVQGVV